MKQCYRAGIVACSNGLPSGAKEELQQLNKTLRMSGIETVWSDYLFAKNEIRSGTGKERAKAVMDFYKDESIDVIFDVSGGDVAQEVLEYLDYACIANARNHFGRKKSFWGYSDLTVLLNAIYTMTGNPGMLYQIRHLPYFLDGINDITLERTQGGLSAILTDKNIGFTCPQYHFLRGEEMYGIVVGGNVRCLLKLANTPYFPDVTGKILFLEARSGLEPQMRAYFGQLQQMGVFEKIAGLYLGTFTQWEKQLEKSIEPLVFEYVPKSVPVAKTFEIGHASASKAIWIGKEMKLTSQKSFNYYEPHEESQQY